VENYIRLNSAAIINFDRAACQGTVDAKAAGTQEGTKKHAQ